MTSQNTETSTVPATADPDHDRRRSLSAEAALLRVRVTARSRPLPAVLLDLSATGFTVETSQPVEVGESCRFELHLPGSPVEVGATCVHTQPTTSRSMPTFVAGFTFDALEDHARDAVLTFVDQMAALAAVEHARHTSP